MNCMTIRLTACFFLSALLCFPLLLHFSNASFLFWIWHTTFAYLPSSLLSLPFLSLSSALAQGKLFLPPHVLFFSSIFLLLTTLSSVLLLSASLSVHAPFFNSSSPFIVPSPLSSFPRLPLQSPSAQMCGWWCSSCCCWCQQWLCLCLSTSALWATTAVWLTAKVRGPSSTLTNTGLRPAVELSCFPIQRGINAYYSAPNLQFVLPSIGLTQTDSRTTDGGQAKLNAVRLTSSACLKSNIFIKKHWMFFILFARFNIRLRS